jgi:hypothetical protein
VTLPVVWLPEAEADLRAAKFWYNDRRSALSDQFVFCSRRHGREFKQKSSAFSHNIP